MSLVKLYVRVLGQLGNQAKIGTALAFSNVALAIAAFAEPVLFGRIIDKLVNAQAQATLISFNVLIPLIFAWVAFGVFNIFAGVLIALYAERLAHSRRLATMANYFEHVLELPLAFHTTTHSGRVLKVMIEGSNGMAWLWLGFFREHCAALVALLFLLPLTVFLNWRLGLLLCLLVVIFTVLTTFVLRRTEALQGSVEKYHSSLAEHASDALGNISVIQSFTRIDAETRALRGITHQVLQAQIPVLSWWAVANVASRASATLTVTAIFILGTWLHLHKLASIGEVVTFMSLATMLIGRLEQAVNFINALFMQSPKIKEFFDILDTVPFVHDRPQARNIDRLQGHIVFDNVTFSYDGKRPALSDASFVVEAGQTIALVGATGSGKSTTLGLLHRAFDPQTGSILIDGVDIRDFTLVSLRRNIGVVFQEPMLFARSVRENLQVGNPFASEADMLLALERAQALEFVNRQSEGLDTIIGERGRSLSGGERQRLSIARALLKNPPILILDEATSALDARTERKLQLALDEVMKGRTTFVIAHRFATIRNAGTILVFDQGRVVEQGGFDELVEKGGQFSELARAQFMVGADILDQDSPL